MGTTVKLVTIRVYLKKHLSVGEWMDNLLVDNLMIFLSTEVTSTDKPT